ncbi:hypothetical protein HUF15_00655 [Streptomyces samsunensis]|uniref:hypothetical protein n=1 Tax=Streptomyces malaysiensis TaxID=92644 RepID=UPI001582364A|nr:hypothetical protein [Streptomyces samsunensis]NUH35291.1 hypothetical protein [Streptomyces samsunensis]
MTDTSPAVQIRAAAEKLRALVTAAAKDSGSPHWIATRNFPNQPDATFTTLWTDSHTVLMRGGGRHREPYVHAPVGDYIATMGPTVGLAIAAWLDNAAEDAEEVGADPRAVTTALALLGQPPQQSGPVAPQTPHNPSTTPEDPGTPERAADGRTAVRVFRLQRDRDITGVSGTGTVADGALWPDGTVSIRWRGDRPSTVTWDSINHAEHVHGHGGATRIIWTDQPDTDPDNRTDNPDSTTDTQTDNPTTSTDTDRTTPDRPCGEDRPAHSAHRYMLGRRVYPCPGAMPNTAAAAQQAEAERDQAYAERAALLAWISALHPANAVITPAEDVDEPGWQLLYLLVSGWQMSWHIAPRDVDLFAHVEHVAPDDPRAQWDGHSTTEKYERIREHTARLSEARASTVRIEIIPDPPHVADAIRLVRRDGGLPPHRR